jgi:hypothetical protein
LTLKLGLVFFTPFALLLIYIFMLDWLANRGRVWTPVESQPVFAYVPTGAHLVSSSHTGWTFTSRCPEHSRCEYTHMFGSPLDEAELRALVERELGALGFVRKPPNPAKCAPYYARSERFAKGDISVWPVYGPTPYRIGKSSSIPVTEGRTVVSLRIDNMELAWGC